MNDRSLSPEGATCVRTNGTKGMLGMNEGWMYETGIIALGSMSAFWTASLISVLFIFLGTIVSNER